MFELSQFIDHTLLRADSTVEDIETLCKEAIRYQFYAVCVNSCHVALAKSLLGSSPIVVASTVGFPLGAASKESKTLEALQAVKDGAQEIDMVINIGYLKSGMYKEVVDDMKSVKQAVGKHVLVKTIFENCLLDDTDIKLASKLAIEAEVDYIKSSTGFQTGSKPKQGAIKEEIEIMLREVAGQGIKVKAAGGITDYKSAMVFIEMGVHRIGTSSGIVIVNSVLEGNDENDKGQDNGEY